jgi:predicted glycoside hydrolase/deacetylase ChbG (UPF0249 family)
MININFPNRPTPKIIIPLAKSLRTSISCTILLLLFTFQVRGQSTFAERLGYPAGKKVLIMHVDDAGMSWDSNQGTIMSMDEGVANSMSVMMPCPWVPDIVSYIHENPEVDAGLHLTLTSEWKKYRWGPLMGKPAVPGLVDEQGAMWRSVAEVVKNASADEVEAEIRAQIERAQAMGFQPTHLDSHMGTLFADEEFLKRYIKVGAEYQIPVMFPGGHISHVKESFRQDIIKDLKNKGVYKEGMDVPLPELLKWAPILGQQIWAAGLPVLDDLHNVSGWDIPDDMERTDQALQDYYTSKYIETIDELEPGLTMVIMHCTKPSEIFSEISSSGDRRRADMLAMMDPRLKKHLEEEGIILTTWREAMERRKSIDN